MQMTRFWFIILEHLRKQCNYQTNIFFFFFFFVFAFFPFTNKQKTNKNRIGKEWTSVPYNVQLIDTSLQFKDNEDNDKDNVRNSVIIGETSCKRHFFFFLSFNSISFHSGFIFFFFISIIYKYTTWILNPAFHKLWSSNFIPICLHRRFRKSWKCFMLGWCFIIHKWYKI